MPAYMIVTARIGDRDAFLSGYAPRAAELVARFGGRYVLRAPGGTMLEGGGGGPISSGSNSGSSCAASGTGAGAGEGRTVDVLGSSFFVAGAVAGFCSHDSV